MTTTRPNASTVRLLCILVSFMFFADKYSANPAQTVRWSDRVITLTSWDEQTDLSGTYVGRVSYPEGGFTGEAILTISGNGFTLTTGSSTVAGRIISVTTGKYIAVVLAFDAVPPKIISLQAQKVGTRFRLFSIHGERQKFSFTSYALTGTAMRRMRNSLPPQASDIPDFPWPPPRASAIAPVARSLLENSNGKTLLREVAARLERAFNQAGYGEISWYRVPSGFAMISRLEQFNDDGTPLPPKDRFSINIPHPRLSSIKEFLRSLFTAKEGHFRVIVFIVTSDPVVQRIESISRDRAMELISGGADRLPEDIGNQEFVVSHKCTALIYEFRKLTADHPAEFMYPSSIDGKAHLRMSGILTALERR